MNQLQNTVLSEAKCCQLCLNYDDEDIAIIVKFADSFSQCKPQSLIKLLQATTTQGDLMVALQSKALMETLSSIFRHKYLEINDKCTHQPLFEFIITIQGESDPVRPTTIVSGQKLILEENEQWQKFVNSREKFLTSQLFFKKFTKKLFTLNNDPDAEQEQGVNLTDNNSDVISNSSNIRQKIFYKIDVQSKHEIKLNKNTQKDEYQMSKYKLLQEWFLENIDNPYPQQEDKNNFAQHTGLTPKQVQNWFTNTRKRYLDPLKKPANLMNVKSELSAMRKKIKTIEPMTKFKERQTLEEPINPAIEEQQIKQEEQYQKTVSQPIKTSTIPQFQQSQQVSDQRADLAQMMIMENQRSLQQQMSYLPNVPQMFIPPFFYPPQFPHYPAFSIQPNPYIPNFYPMMNPSYLQGFNMQIPGQFKENQ